MARRKIAKRGVHKLNPKTTNERVREVYDRMDMTYAEFAAFLDVSPHSVEAWFKPKSSKSRRVPQAPVAALAESREREHLRG